MLPARRRSIKVPVLLFSLNSRRFWRVLHRANRSRNGFFIGAGGHAKLRGNHGAILDVNSKAILAAVLLAPAGCTAVSLGELVVNSYLGETFAAELTVSRDPADDPGRYAIEVGAAVDYARLELPKPPAVDWIQAGDARLDGGRWVVPLTSERVVDELVLDLVLVLSRPGAVESRHYPVLLDLPARVSMPEQTPRSTPSPRPAPVPSAVPPPVAPAGDTAEVRPSGTIYRVQPGDSLYAIARRYRGERALDEVADAFFQLNQDAFVNGNRNRLLAGAELDVPAELAAPRPRSSEQPTRRDQPPAGLREPPGRAADADRVRLRAPPGPDEIVESLADWLDADDEVISGQRTEIDRDLAFARTEIETFQQQNENLKERIANLERRLQDLQRLMELREQEDGAAATRGAGETRGAGVATPTTSEDSRPGIEAPADQPPAGGHPGSYAWLPYAVGLGALGLVGLWFFRQVRAQRRQRASGVLREPRADDSYLPDGL